MADKNFLTDIIDADLAEGKVKEIEEGLDIYEHGESAYN